MKKRKKAARSYRSLTPAKRRLSLSASSREPLSVRHLKFAKKIHQTGYIYALHGLLDGGVAAYGGMKFFFDMLSTTQSSNASIHDWLQTPEGISFALTEAMVFAGLSLIANISEENTSNAFKQATAAFWPYCRSSVSELKKASRAVSNTLKIASFFKDQSFDHVLMPFGFAMGAVSVVNRVWFRRMQNRRELVKNQLHTLEKKIIALTESECEDRNTLQHYYQNIPVQSPTDQKLAYLSAAYTGLIEAVAFHIGILTFVSLTSPAFIPLVTCCMAFAILSIATRIHEEYEHQRRLEVSSLIITLRLKQKELTSLTMLSKIQQVDEFQFEILYQDILKYSNKLKAKGITTFDKTLKGTRQGLTVYAFINKIIFGVTVFFSVVPVALAISSVFIGILILLCTTIKAAKQQTKPLKIQLDKQVLLEKNIPALMSLFVDDLIETYHPVDKAKSFWRSWFDVAWAFFSGLDKGRKNTGYFLMVSFAERSLHEDYLQSPIMINLSIALGVISSLIFSLRTYAVSFGATSEKKLTETTSSFCPPLLEQVNGDKEGRHNYSFA
ncbi:hypothetical protein [Legionella jamestowniensis]|uniref:Transmembrane protein n=1 Tax=Legionella jamestowniensis TaxID=455 RepID=A0A0W0V0K4_9GAMM|nr:hypothetical protein [Legionella jamestowniensis]KTD13257.1 transmembrane protein [Legionella jamestowniensis]SFL77997.1 hypothetical protein SAMN02746073_1881 [Legionella jamestowniensis DSM 19215]